MMSEKISCARCGNKLQLDDKSCPKCNSKNRLIELRIEENVRIHDQIKGKQKRKGYKRPIREFKVGDNLHNKSGKWNYRELDIDRENDSYKEIITDKGTGDIIHQCKEPLSKHRGHGSAKKK